MSILNVGPNFIQYKRDDVRFHSQEQDITFVYCLLVAGGEINAQFLKKKQIISTFLKKISDGNSKYAPIEMIQNSSLLTRSWWTVGRSVSGELAVILWIAITPSGGKSQENIQD